MKVEKFNEFLSNDNTELLKLIESAEMTNLSDPVKISESENYRKVVNFGKLSLPILIERKSYIWNIALKEITGIEPIGVKSSEIVNFWVNWGKENGY